MARRNVLISLLTKAARDAERQRKARLREQTRIAKEAERAEKAYL